jgi:hypothetical protein
VRQANTEWRMAKGKKVGETRQAKSAKVAKGGSGVAERLIVRWRAVVETQGGQECQAARGLFGTLGYSDLGCERMRGIG